MRGNKFQIKLKLLMYKIQDFGWMNISQFIFDLYDIVMWLIQYIQLCIIDVYV